MDVEKLDTVTYNLSGSVSMGDWGTDTEYDEPEYPPDDTDNDPDGFLA